MKTVASSIHPAPALLETRIGFPQGAPPGHGARCALRLPCPLLPALIPVLVPALVLALAGLAGCGSPGTPQPPSLKLPTPPGDLTASRSGNSVTLHWTMPRRATDRVLLSGDQRAVICRSVGTAGSGCNPAGALLVAAGQPVTYTDALPPLLATGRPRLLTYTVELENHKKRSAGLSNPAYSAAGAPPPSIDNLRAQTTAAGIVLHWMPPSEARASGASGASAAGSAPSTGGSTLPGARYRLRLQRTRILPPGESPEPTAEETRAGVPQPVQQTLEVPQPTDPASGGRMDGGWTLDHAIDGDARLNRTYRYTVERVARLDLAGHLVEVSGGVSAPVTIDARDVFAPAMPQGLEAVADDQGGAIDLSWTADTEADLAGYRVYRRIAANSEPAVRVSGTALLSDPAWRDPSALPGVRYAYSVSATDKSGNESARSPEVIETLSH